MVFDSDEYKSKYSGCKLVYVSAEGQTSYKDMPLNMRKLLSILGIDENNITPVTDITKFKRLLCRMNPSITTRMRQGFYKRI